MPDINRSLADVNSLLLQVLNENIFEQPELTSLIDRRYRRRTSGESRRTVERFATDLIRELDELRNISTFG